MPIRFMIAKYIDYTKHSFCLQGEGSLFLQNISGDHMVGVTPQNIEHYRGFPLQ